VNRAIVRALLRDAYYQVVDNLGFRILLVLFLLPGLFFLLFSFRTDGIWVVGTWQLNADWLTSGRATPPNAEALEQLLQMRLDNIVDSVLSVFDLFASVFAIAAVSFFVPQMLERGGADVVFSKPVSRLALYLSRYVAGLAFVSLLAVVLIGGVFSGLWLASGYFQPRLMWAIPALVYGFASLHAISCLFGVLTRSSIAAILLTVVFMPINYGLHKAFEEHAVEQHVAAATDKPAKPVSAASAAFAVVLDAYHLVGPKNGDGERLAKALRERLDYVEPEFVDEDLGLTIDASPEGFRREPRSALRQDGLTWLAPHPDGGGEASWRFKAESVERAGELSAVSKALRKELGVDSKPTIIGEITGRRFEWTEQRGQESRLRRRWLVQINDELLTVDYDAEAAWAAREDSERMARAFTSAWQLEGDAKRRARTASYDELFAWDAPWRFNSVLSILTTLLFIALTLALGWWKLSRIDF
jgi:ABC-type transport system involved in multi-copper enzyme maturation permease subunit